jgi:hypothetical protein
MYSKGVNAFILWVGSIIKFIKDTRPSFPFLLEFGVWNLDFGTSKRQQSIPVSA